MRHPEFNKRGVSCLYAATPLATRKWFNGINDPNQLLIFAVLVAM